MSEEREQGQGRMLFEVGSDDEGTRLDRFVRRLVPGSGFSLVQKLTRKGALRIDGKRAKPHTRLALGQSISLPKTLVDLLEEKNKEKKSLLVGRATALPPSQQRWLDVLQATKIEDSADFLVLNKPAGLAVQGGSKTHEHVDGLLEHFADQEGRRPKLVHRLDRDTSGLLLTARGKLASELAKNFATREVKKRYLAWCWGRPLNDRGVQTAKLLKRAGRRADSKDRERPDERVVVDEDLGQFAQSQYCVLASGRLCAGSGPRISLIQWSPLTGRTHQLRVHAAHLGNSIVGDPKYGSAPRLDLSNSEQKLLAQLGLMLHARALSLTIKGKQKRFIAPIPEPMLQVGRVIGLHNFEEVEHEFGT